MTYTYLLAINRPDGSAVFLRQFTCAVWRDLKVREDDAASVLATALRLMPTMPIVGAFEITISRITEEP